jgi:hypothetical protein
MQLQRCECNFCVLSNLKNFCWLGYVLFWSTVVPIIDSKKTQFEFVCQPRTVIRVEEMRGRGALTSLQGGKVGRQTYWHRSIGFQFVSFAYIDQYDSNLVILSCWLVYKRVWITVASTFPSDSEQMLRKYLPSDCIMLEDNQNKT